MDSGRSSCSSRPAKAALHSAEVDSPSVTKTLIDNSAATDSPHLREGKVSITGGIGVQPRGVQLRIPMRSERAKVMPKLRELSLVGPQPGIALAPLGSRRST